MANVNHSNLTDPYLHEPKGAAAAGSGEMYVADGLGSGGFQVAMPHGGWRYNDIGTGTTYTTPTTYTLLNVAGSATHLDDFTFNSAGRLTFTGSKSKHLHAVCDLSFKHSSGGGNDIYFAVYKNGALLSAGTDVEIVQTADSANYVHIAIHFDDLASTNDYYEIYIKTATGNIIVHTAYMFAMGMPH